MFDRNFAAKHLSPQHIIPATLKIHLPSLVIIMTDVEQRRWLGKPPGLQEKVVLETKLWITWSMGNLHKANSKIFMGVTSLNLHWLLNKLHTQGSSSSVNRWSKRLGLELLTHRKSTSHRSGWGRWSTVLLQNGNDISRRKTFSSSFND